MITLESLLEEMTDRDAAARWPQPEYVGRQASSYDRTQTDPNDRETWFANKDYWECIRKETTSRGDEWVIMEDPGPGCISRIWLPILPEDDGRLVRFYLDGDPDPVIEVSFNHLITGKAFVKPPFAAISSDEEKIARMYELPPGEGLVGSDLFLPIAYAKSCRIALNEMPFYYIINYRSYAPGTEVETFTMERFQAAAAAISQAGAALVASGSVGSGRPESRAARLDPGQTLAVETPSGPGAIRSLALSLPPTLTKDDLRSLVLHMSFDGEETVCCPVSEFFGGGIAVSPVRDWNREVTADGRFTCWSVMPYQTAGRVWISNSGSKAVDAELELSVGAWDWNDRSMHYHANWRIASPIEGPLPQDWNYITISGQGIYAGDTLSVLNPQSLWYGEGDERVYVDGEAFPSQLGTGTEDYYGFAWGMADEFSSPFIAMPRRESTGRTGADTRPRPARASSTRSRFDRLCASTWRRGTGRTGNVWSMPPRRSGMPGPARRTTARCNYPGAAKRTATDLPTTVATLSDSGMRIGLNQHRFGVNYTPTRSWWYCWNDFDSGAITRDLDAIAKIGADHIRIMLVWPYFQPNPSVVSPAHLERLNTLMGLAAERQLDVCVSLFVGWLSGYAFKPPFQPDASFYRLSESKPRQELYMKSVAEEMKQHDNFLGLDLGNELNCCWQADELEIGDQWSSHMLALAEECLPKGVHVNGVDHNPWFGPSTFSPRGLANTQKIIPLHCWTFFTGALDRAGGDCFDAKCVRLPEAMAGLARSYANDAHKPVWIQEYGMSEDWTPQKNIPRFLHETTLNAIHAGVNWFTWWASHDLDRQCEFGSLEYSLGLITHDQKIKASGEAFKELADTYGGQEVSQTGGIDLPVPPRVFDEESTWSQLEQWIAIRDGAHPDAAADAGERRNA